jgi:hypothetical protein
MLEGIENDLVNTVVTGALAVAATGFVKYQLDKLAVHYGITIDPNIRDIVEATAWPTGVINPKTGREFKEFRIRRVKPEVKLENIIGHNRFHKKYIHKAFKRAKMLQGESELAFQWRQAQYLFTQEVMPVGEDFILLLNLADVVPKAGFRRYMDKLESTYRANLGAIFDDDRLQALGVGPRDYKDEDYALPLLILDPVNEEMRIVMFSHLAITDPEYFPHPEDCVVRIVPGRRLPEAATADDGFTFSTKLGTYYRAPQIPRFNALFQKAGVLRTIAGMIEGNQELYNFMVAIPTERVHHVPMPVTPGIQEITPVAE